MEKVIVRFLLTALVAALALPAFSRGPEDPIIAPLYTQGNDGQAKILIGEVHIWNDPLNLCVKYRITNADWRLSRTYVHVSAKTDGLSLKKSLLHSNRYESEKFHSGLREFTHLVKINWVAPRELNVEVYADVLPIHGYTSDVIGFGETLPETISMSVVHPSPDRHAYSLLTIAEGDFLDGFHYSWCVDLDRKIKQRFWYTADVYSIFEELPYFFMEHPENLDLVNWILNQNFVGKNSPFEEKFTFGDIQRLIWDLLDNENMEYGLGPWSQQRVDYILAEAKVNGEGFIPGCNQRLMLILVPVDELKKVIAQPLGIVIPVPCIPTVQQATASAHVVYESDDKWGSFFATPIRLNRENFPF